MDNQNLQSVRAYEDGDDDAAGTRNEALDRPKARLIKVGLTTAPCQEIIQPASPRCRPMQPSSQAAELVAAGTPAAQPNNWDVGILGQRAPFHYSHTVHENTAEDGNALG